MRIRIVFMLLNASLVFSASTVFSISPAPVPGWVHGNGTLLQAGALAAGGAIINSSIAAGEIDGVKQNGKEVAAASADGTVQVFRSNGSLLWVAHTPNSECGSATDRVSSSPSIGALKGKGKYHVVIGYGGFAGPECDGGVIAFNGLDGSIAWTFSLRDFAKKNRYSALHFGVYSTPALADVDKNGQLEIGFGALDRNVYLLNSNGKVRWYYNAADTVFSSPAFANIDKDKDLEMIIGTDISQNKALRPPTKNGGFLYAFKTSRPKGSSSHISFNQRGAYIWRKYFDQTIQSSPVVANVISKKSGPEIMVGSGCTFPTTTTLKNGAWLKILSAKDGRLLKTLIAPTCFSSSPAVGDINNDGALEIVATVNGTTAFGGDGVSRIVAWSADSSNPLWSAVPSPGGRNDSYGGTLQSPVIADLDGNGSLEVIAANASGVAILNGVDGSALSCQQSRCSPNIVSVQSESTLKSTAFIDDINLDGVLDLLIGGSSGNQGAVYAWSFFNDYLGSSAGPKAAYSNPWSTYRGDAKREGIHH